MPFGSEFRFSFRIVSEEANWTFFPFAIRSEKIKILPPFPLLQSRSSETSLGREVWSHVTWQWRCLSCFWESSGELSSARVLYGLNGRSEIFHSDSKPWPNGRYDVPWSWIHNKVNLIVGYLTWYLYARYSRPAYLCTFQGVHRVYTVMSRKSGAHTFRVLIMLHIKEKKNAHLPCQQKSINSGFWKRK